MHFMVHMPRLIIRQVFSAVHAVLFSKYYSRFGPLVRHWTMRFEAKHSYFKQLARSMGNFINLPYSLAFRHQEYQCYLNATTKGLHGSVDDIDIGPGDHLITIICTERYWK